MNEKELYETAEELFTKRSSFMSLCQEIAENFYPERADFTLRREIGTQFAGDLMSSYPVLCRRDLGDQISVMLRPTEQPWMRMVPTDTRIDDNDSRAWLEWATATQRRAMYDRAALFTRAAKEGDHDYATFGQTVLSIELNRHADAFLYRCWHLRDVAWMEDQDGKVCSVFRKWKPKARELTKLFKNVHRNVADTAKKKPFEEIDCIHMVVEAEMYDGDARGRPRWSIYYDCSNSHLIEATPIWHRIYVIPRWQTVSGSQYALSPATITALPDARLIQAMTATLLEAGEKIVNPPMVATKDAVRSDIAIYAGGTTWVDIDYDERLGEALRPMSLDSKGMPIGIDMQRDSRAMIMQAFFLNKLSLPQRGTEMTAYEIAQRTQEYIRGALPLFEPMEVDYNGSVCEETFELGMRSGLFGPVWNMPKSLRGANIEFRFKSPLHDAIEQQKGHKFIESKQLIAEAMTIDQSAIALIDAKVALRDALSGIQTPAKWLRSEVSVKDIERAQNAARQAQQLLGAIQQGSEIAANLGSAKKDMTVPA